MMKEWDQAFKLAKELAKSGTQKAKSREISEGDRYSYDQGEEVELEIAGKQYRIGYIFRTEDDDEWAQAECYEMSWCQEGDRNIDAAKLKEAIENAKSIERENKMASIGI
jgi:hypothetical protein